MTIINFCPPLCESLLIAAVHLPSKLRADKDRQFLAAQNVAEGIKWAEEQEGHDRTVLVGDLNMNPFEEGVISAAGLNGAMTRHRALKKPRIIEQKPYKYFFNPMWTKFGDRTEGCPPGTYHYKSSNPVDFGWNIFDQVLLRPLLVDNFDDSSLRIITQLNSRALRVAGSGVPCKRHGSDHFPLVFKLKLNLK